MTSDFGEYRLLRLLGEGGMAQVWAARRRGSGPNPECAVKIIKPAHADQAAHREMFIREGQLSLILSGHDNVVSVFDMGEHEGRPYLAMELVDGVTLTELTRRVGGPWPVAQAVSVVADVLRALCHIHDLGEAQGIVHRDVTPHNVMVSARGEVKLMDFGIAQRADAEPSLDQALGKLSYVPREQVEGDPDARADLYSAGAVLFELLDGRRFRWHCADEDALFQEIYRNRVPTLRRKDVPAPVLEVLRGLLQPYRERRIASAEEALRQLEAWEGFASGASGLAELHAEAIGPRAQRPASSPQPQVEAPDVPLARPWDEVRPTAEHPRSHPWLMAQDVVAPPSQVPTQSHPLEVVDVADTDELIVAEPVVEGDSVPQRRPRQHSSPAWAPEVTRPPSGSADVPTRVVPVAQRDLRLGTDPMERLVTRRHPAALEQDVPLARNSAEIAVTEPQPSRRAPWAEGTQPIEPPIEQRVMRPEPGAPVLRRRPRSSGSSYDPFDRTGSVSPRARESASVHQVAGDSDVVAGEIVTDDGLDEAFAPSRWRVGHPMR